MAAPKLKTTAVPNAPVRVLRPSGVVPTTKPKLKGADGKVIQPKLAKPASTPTPAPAPAPAVDPAAEAEAAAQAEAAAAAEAEAAAQAAQEEYERQMEEYNRQMEEYNRALAAQQAEEEARAAAEAEAAAQAEAAAKAAAEAQAAATPADSEADAAVAIQAAAAVAATEEASKPAPKKTAPKPAGLRPAGAKLGVAKPGAAKPGAPKPAAKKAAPKPPAAAPAAEGEAPVEGESAPEMSESELAARDTMLRAMQLEAAKPPLWKRPGLLIGTGAVVALFAICGTLIAQDQAEKAAAKAYEDSVNRLLIRATEINKQRIETLNDAKAKGVEIVCTQADAECLLSIVVNPFVKKDNGKNMLGGDPKGVARQACLLLGIASEKDAAIDSLIFKTLAEECNNETFPPDLFRWLLQRMTISNNKGINKKLKKLAKDVAKKDTMKGKETKWRKKGEVLAAIWECIGLRVTPKDIPEIVSLLKDEACENQLANTLANCLDNIVMMVDDPAEKAKVGDTIFEALPKELIANMAGTLAHTCSPKALEYYKKRAEDPKNWKGDAVFFGNYYNDDIVPYLQELKSKAGGDAKKEQIIDRCISSIASQNRPRSIEAANQLLGLVFDKLNEDTSQWADIIDKTDPDGANFIGKDNPQYASLMERRKALEQCRGQKLTLIRTLSGLDNHEWVVNLLEKFMKDPDSDVSSDATRARERVDKNAADAKALRATYKSRDKE